MKTYQNILCAVDLSPSSDSICARAVELARRFDAKLIMAHVIDHFPEDRSNTLIAPEDTDPAEFRASHARSGLEAVADRLGFTGTRYEVMFTTRSAWHEIVDLAEDGKMDLIVVGSHGTHGIAALFGSTANNVLRHAPCDVLAVYTTE